MCHYHTRNSAAAANKNGRTYLFEDCSFFSSFFWTESASFNRSAGREGDNAVRPTASLNIQGMTD